MPPYLAKTLRVHSMVASFKTLHKLSKYLQNKLNGGPNEKEMVAIRVFYFELTHFGTPDKMIPHETLHVGIKKPLHLLSIHRGLLNSKEMVVSKSISFKLTHPIAISAIK